MQKMLELVDSDPPRDAATSLRRSGRNGDPSHSVFGRGRYLEILVSPAPNIPVNLALV